MSCVPDLTLLYENLDRAGVEVFSYSLAPYDAISSPRGYLAMDPGLILDDVQEREVLIHEAGHFATDTFYQLDSPYTVRQHQENIAARWGYRRYFPLDTILDLMRSGCAEPWQLAEQLGVSEIYVRGLLEYYSEACGIDFAAVAAAAG